MLHCNPFIALRALGSQGSIKNPNDVPECWVLHLEFWFSLHVKEWVIWQSPIDSIFEKKQLNFFWLQSTAILDQNILPFSHPLAYFRW